MDLLHYGGVQFGFGCDFCNRLAWRLRMIHGGIDAESTDVGCHFDASWSTIPSFTKHLRVTISSSLLALDVGRSWFSTNQSCYVEICLTRMSNPLAIYACSGIQL